MTTLLLVRHGETDWNAEGRLQGQTDRPLNDFGRRQARALADGLAGERLEAIYASDLARARETAEILGTRLGLVGRPRQGPAREGLGKLGRPHAIERDRGRVRRRVDRRHTGARTLRALRRIAERHPGGRVLVVTHGGSMRRVQAVTLGLALPVVDNCGRWTCVCENGSSGR